MRMTSLRSVLAAPLFALAFAVPLAAQSAPATPADGPAAPTAPVAQAATPAPASQSAPSAPAAPSAGKPLAVRKGVGRFPFEEATLDNGLRVVSLEDHSTPIVAVQLWYHVGSKNEQPDRQGFAHMFEHMMFRGTDRLGPKDHFDYIRKSGGDCNAFTAFDQTVYVQELPSNQLPMVLWLEAERMSALKIDEGGFHTERKVVEEERRLGLNQPYGDVLEKLLANLFTVQPYRWSPIGQIEHLEASTPDDIQKFWDTYYVPNNCTLVVVGDVTGEQVRDLAQKSFGWIPRCADPPRPTAVDPEQKELRKVLIEPQNGPVPIAGIAFRAVPEGHPDAVALGMLMSIMGGGESSRVYLDLVRRKDIAVVGLGLYAGLEQAGFAAIVGVLNPLGSTQPVLDALWEQVEKVKTEGVTPEELAKAKKQALRADVDKAATVASKAGVLGEAATLFGDTQEANERVKRTEAVTADDLKRVANTYFVKEHATEVVIKPSVLSALRTVLTAAAGKDDKSKDEPAKEEEGGKRATAGGPKASAHPPTGYPEKPPVAPPLAAKIDISGNEQKLDNGLKLVVVENHELPMVSISLRLRAGSFTDDPAHPGTASLAASMITKGTVAHGAEALAADMEKSAIELGASADSDGAVVNASSLTADADHAMRLLAEVVSTPKFDAKEFKTLRDQTATGMAIQEKTPAVIADRQFEKALWGSHPYGHPAEGTSDDLKKLTPEALHAWWTTFVRPETSVLYMAGDITPADAHALAERYLGDWEAEGDAIPVPLPDLTPAGAMHIVLVDKPGAIQSEIIAGHEGIVRSNPLFATGAVLSQVFGGAFSSRLNDVIRVQKGLTYGANGGLSSQRFGGKFRVRTFTKTPTTAETVQAVIDEVKRMRTEPPSEKELTSAESYLVGSFAGTLETPEAVAGRLWTLDVNGLPKTWWNDYLKKVAATTSEDVAHAADELLDPSRLIIVVVGDASQVKESLQKIAPVEVITEGG
jgi:zinc protease